MENLRSRWVLATIVVAIWFSLTVTSHAEDQIVLDTAWRVQSAAAIDATGAGLAAAGFADGGWYATAVPSTVLGALVNDGVYTNVFFGTNFAGIPTAPFTNGWWFRREFSISDSQAAENADLVFKGINYRANIWLNGEKVAATNQAYGAFRIFSFDVHGKLKAGKNALAVEVFAPQPGDYTMGFVDWNPKPPGGQMGLFRPVEVHFHKAVALKNVFVESKIDHATWQSAELTIRADLENKTDQSIEARVNGQIGDVHFGETFALAPREKRSVALSREKNPGLKFAQAALWWPWELGEAHLYDLKLSAETGGEISDAQQVRFGIREVADYISPEGYRGYMVNGRKILIRGGGWADELFLRESETNLEAQLQYTKAMNLNTVRLEGVWGSSERLYNLADEYGLLIMVGWSCQWEWEDGLGKKTDEFGAFQSEEDMDLVTNYLHDQVFWLRNHPSIFVWALGSDKHPRPELEARYDALMKTIDPTRPTLKSCAGIVSKISGPSAVKMNGPYDYVTPDYWFLDKKNGGAFGFNTETGPGPQPPTIESLRRMIPADHLWPIDGEWNFHCCRGQFGDLNRYLKAFDAHYGEVTNVEEFAFKSQAANYDAMRAMYEAFAANLPHTTGIIQWMLNPSWPRMYWQLYDYYLAPGGAFFGAKRGASPIAVIYNYGDAGVYLVNQTGKTLSNYHTTISVYDSHSEKILEESVATATLPYGSQKIYDLSKLAPKTSVYFLDLKAVGNADEAEADNFYWLSTKPDELDEAKSTWFVTPNKSFADFTALNHLPSAEVKADVRFSAAPQGRAENADASVEVTLTNTTDKLAFFIEMKVVGEKSRQMLAPIFWDDNYVSLPPHATKTIRAHFHSREKPALTLQGWNVRFQN